MHAKPKPIPWLLLLSVCLVGGCDNSKEEEARLAVLESEKAALDEQFQQAQDRLSEIRDTVTGLQEELATITAEADAIPAQTEAIKPYRETLAELEMPMQRHLDFWKQATRESLRGLALGDVELIGGQLLQNVVIVEITDQEIQATANGQSVSIDPEDLPVETRVQLVDESLVKTRVDAGEGPSSGQP